MADNADHVQLIQDPKQAVIGSHLVVTDTWASMGQEDEKKAREAGVFSGIKLLGSMPHNDIVQWMNASDLLVLPSYNEGVPNVVLESMACGTPVVAFDSPGDINKIIIYLFI